MTYALKDLEVYTGRMFYTGNNSCFINSPMGKNTLSAIPKEVARILGKDNPDGYSFHSLRRLSATTAADNGATVAQMMDFYGWAQPSMPQEYISSSKHAVKCMAEKLKGSSDCSTSSTDDPNINTLRPQENSIPGGVNKFVYIEHFSGTFNL